MSGTRGFVLGAVLVIGVPALAGVFISGQGSGAAVASITATAPTDVAVSGSATLVHTAAAGDCAVIVQNDENAIVTCGQTNAVTLTGPGIKLKACTVDDDGTGGSFTFQNYGGAVWCVTSSAAQVNVSVIKCP